MVMIIIIIVIHIHVIIDYRVISKALYNVRLRLQEKYEKHVFTCRWSIDLSLF